MNGESIEGFATDDPERAERFEELLSAEHGYGILELLDGDGEETD
jgi:hypothetical protein